MFELTTQEIEETVGAGVVDQLISLGLGLVGSYIYESVGGAQGINNFAAGMVGSMTGPSYLAGSGRG